MYGGSGCCALVSVMSMLQRCSAVGAPAQEDASIEQEALEDGPLHGTGKSSTSSYGSKHAAWPISHTAVEGLLHRTSPTAGPALRYVATVPHASAIPCGLRHGSLTPRLLLLSSTKSTTQRWTARDSSRPSHLHNTSCHGCGVPCHARVRPTTPESLLARTLKCAALRHIVAAL